MQLESKKTAILFCFFLGLMGLIVGGSSLVKWTRYLPVEAVITRIEREYDSTEGEYRYRTFAKYQVDDREYEGDIGYYASGFKEGKIIEIRYNPSDPSQVEAAPPGILLYITAAGVLLTGAGVYILIRGKEAVPTA